MLILELAVQAVRGFSPAARVALKPGYIGLASPGEIPAPLAGLFVALAYPDGRGGESSFLAPGAPAGRAGFSLQANDGTVWRIVRDLGGAGALHRTSRPGGPFEVVSEDSAEMAQMLRASVGFPVRTTFEQLFTFTAGQLPSRRPRARTGATGQTTAFSPSGLRQAPAAPTSDVEGTRAKITALENELVQAKNVAEMQFRADGVQSEIFQAEQRLRAVEDLRTQLTEARAELESAPSPGSMGLPDDIGDRVRRFSETKKRFNEAMAKLEDEREQAGLHGRMHVEPLYKDNRFLGALAGGIALMVCGAYLEGGARYVALLAIPAFSFAALLALRFIEDLQYASREGAKAEVFSQREKKARDEYQLQSSIVEAALEKVGATTDEEFFAALAKRQTLEPRVAELTMQLADLESSSEVNDLARRIATMKDEFEALNAQLAAQTGGYARDAREIEREIAYLKESLAPAVAPGQFQAVATGPGQTFDDPVPALMILGADLFATDIPSLWGALRDRVAQYLAALTDRRYHGVEVDKDGRAVVLAPGREIPAGELPPRDLDILYLSTKLTLIEKSAPQVRLPVILEDTLASVLDQTKQPLFGRMLKHIGSLTQVLHVTGAGQNAVAADTQLTL